MSYMNRGDFSSIKGNLKENNIGGHYRYYRYFRYYVPLDNTYVLMQIAVTFIIVIAAVISFFVNYKIKIIDPIEVTKKIFIYSHLIIVGILLLVSLIINFISKTESTLVKRLTTVLIISVLVMFVFIGIKLNFDKTYNEKKFEQFYNEQNLTNLSSNSKKIFDVGLLGFGIKDEKEYYIDECLEAYTVFTTRSQVILGANALFNCLLIFQIIKLIKIQNKKERLDRDDLILFDEEQNIKY